MHQPAHMPRLGLDVAVAGVAFGVVVLVVFAIGRIGGRAGPGRGPAGRITGAEPPAPSPRRPPAGIAGHRGTARTGRPGTQQPVLSSSRYSAAWRSAARRSVAGGHAGRDGAARSGRPPLLNPTSVYTPGGLIDPPGEGRAPGTPDGQDIPEILRTAGPAPAPGGPVPGAHAGGRGQERPPSGWAGPQPPRPGFPPGMNPGGPGRMPHGPGGQPAPPVPPHEYRRPREAPRAGHPMPGRHGAPGRESFPPRGAGPGQTRVMPRARAPWDPADPSGRAAQCRRAIPPTRRRARGAPGTAAPDETRPVRDTEPPEPPDTAPPDTEPLDTAPPDMEPPDMEPLAATGRGRRVTRMPPGTAARPTTTRPSTAATRRSSARRITPSARRAGPGRRASTAPPSRLLLPGRPPACTSTGTPTTSRAVPPRPGRDRAGTTPRTGTTCPAVPPGPAPRHSRVKKPAARSSRWCRPPIRRVRPAVPPRPVPPSPPSRTPHTRTSRRRLRGGRRARGVGVRPRAQARADQGSVPDRGGDRRGERRQALRPSAGPAARAHQRLLPAARPGRVSGRAQPARPGRLRGASRAAGPPGPPGTTFPTDRFPAGRFPAGRRPRPRVLASPPTSPAHGDPGRADAGHRGTRPW